MLYEIIQIFGGDYVAKAIVDSTDGLNVYYGWTSKAGAALSDPEWNIVKVNTAGTIVTYSTPVGSAGQDNAWTDRGTYTYA